VNKKRGRGLLPQMKWTTSAGTYSSSGRRRDGGRSDTGQLGHGLGSARFRLSDQQAEE
jgi:hypothetical protein